MATLTISYFGSYSDGCAMDPLGEEAVTTSGTSAQSTFATNKFPRFAKLQSAAAHHVATGTNPTATATNGFTLGADEVMWLRMNSGYKLAAITA